MEGKAKTVATRGKADLTSIQWLANLVRYWHAHKTNQTGLLHHSHRTEEEKRLRRNKKAREARAKAKGK